VVTVPAYFDEHQRQATRDAGTIAGLDIVRILNEPTAAALAYGAHRVSDKRRLIAVFDLGGGTFDISVMSVDSGIFEVLATGGDSSLGGEDWDRRIVDTIADESSIAGASTWPARRWRSSGLEEAERAKQALSTEGDRRPPALPGPGRRWPADHYERKFTATTSSSAPATCSSGRAAPAARPHRRRRRAGGHRGGAAGRRHDPRPAVSRWSSRSSACGRPRAPTPTDGRPGRRLYAGILAGDHDDATLLDVTPHDLGIKVGEAGFSVLIPRNSMLPVRVRKLFATTTPDQRFVSIELYQGEHADVRKNRRLGQVVLDGLPPGPAGSVDHDVDRDRGAHHRQEAGDPAATGGLSRRRSSDHLAPPRRGPRQGRPGGDGGSVSRVPTRDMPVIGKPDDPEKK
jgi:hypothetical protein